MIQTLGLPLLSLAVPNIHKLNDINADSLSCMWTVFSKCKDNLENGRRLENMSWRLWYRESMIQETNKASEKQQQKSDPILMPSNKAVVAVAPNLTEKPLTPKSFTRIISTLNENEIIDRPQQHPTKQVQYEEIPPQPSCHNKFFIEEDNESDGDEPDYSNEGYLKGDDHNKCCMRSDVMPTHKPSFYAVHDEATYYEVSDDDDADDDADDGTDADVDDDADTDTDADTDDDDYQDNADGGCITTMTKNLFVSTHIRSIQTDPCQLEFTKQIPTANGNTKGFSLLSNMFRSHVAPDKHINH